MALSASRTLASSVARAPAFLCDAYTKKNAPPTITRRLIKAKNRCTAKALSDGSLASGSRNCQEDVASHMPRGSIMPHRNMGIITKTNRIKASAPADSYFRRLRPHRPLVLIRPPSNTLKQSQRRRLESSDAVCTRVAGTALSWSRSVCA